MAKVKICGLTRPSDAALAVQHDAWALGMVMWPASPRHCEPSKAAQIADENRRSAEIAGVFVDQTLDEVVNLTNEIGFSIVQLHGDEGQQFCKAVAQRTGARVIKSFRVRDRSVLAEMGQHLDVDFHLLDSFQAGVPGGTGETFDWGFLAEHPRRGDVPLILSGGLTPENVADAFRTVRPYAVDVASGVEREPGVKDPRTLSAFFAALDGLPGSDAQSEAPATGADDEVLTLGYARETLAESTDVDRDQADVAKSEESR